MKKSAAVIFLFLLFVPSLSATPLTWIFLGTTTAGSQFNGSPSVGLTFELRVFLDTNQVGMTVAGLSDVFFGGPHPSEIEIQGLGIKPLNNFTNIGYFLELPVSAHQAMGVELNQPSFNQILFPNVISTDALHLTPISPVTPAGFNTLSMIQGPNGLFVNGTVNTFSAVAVPETSTATMLVCAFAMIGALRLKRRRASN
jgi:hypothetical protein